MAVIAGKLLEDGVVSREQDRYLLAADMFGHLADNKPEEAQHL
jgi:hypothetical protein